MKRRAEVKDDEKKDGRNESSVSTSHPSKVSRNECGLLSNRLYFTKILGHPQRFSTDALSLKELIEAITPIASIHFNFMIDLPWLLAQYPTKCAESPITVIVGESSGSSFMDIRTAIRRTNAKNVTVGRARLPIPYGTHHTKLSIFETDAQCIHLIISTANLLQSDWDNKTQAFYHCTANIVEGDDPKHSDFQHDLVNYLNVYSTSPEFGMIQYWRDRILNADLSAVTARIISSCPGYHKGATMSNFGHLRLRKVLRSLDVKLTKPSFIAQCSSIGSLGPKPESWLTGQFLHSLAGGTSVAGSSLSMIYPCAEDVRNSVEGYLAGGSLPYQSNTAARQPYLQSIMHKWKCERFGRTRVMPHIKSYAVFSHQSTTPQWILITSANLSKAAWGELQKKDSQLGIRSYELGVLLTDEQSLALLPYDLPLTKYQSGDKPWLCDHIYNKPDIHGATWP